MRQSVFCAPVTQCLSPSVPMQQYSRGNNSVQTNSLKDLLQNKIDDMEKQVLSRVNTLEETKPVSRNDTEQRNRVESTLTSLHHRITDLEKGAFRASGARASTRTSTALTAAVLEL